MADEPRSNLVALRERRERAIAQLSEAFARDDLELEEFERRLTIAHRSESAAELDGLVADLAAPEKSSALVPVATAAPERVRDRQTLMAILGGATRRGHWTPPRKLRVVAVLGGSDLDFREATLAPGVTEVSISAWLGGVNIIVPPTLAVEMDGSAIMGGFEHTERVPQSPDPDRPILRVTGFACMGGVHIETRLPGQSERQARRAARAEPRALRDAARAQRRLPPHEDS
ncbi:MAG TPA: LiaF domain-containing protein [Polyangia bacterium]|nr:LiaF domain-containing protein [Polyangia bacterium]